MKRTLALAALLTLLTAVESALSGELLNNEALYLFAAWKWWRPEFLAHDWTFAVPWREHALFNATAGLPSLVLPFAAFKWLLRLAGWFAVYAALLGLLRRLAVPWWASAAGILLWQVGGEAFVGGEWVIGGAEAKVPAYAALCLALSAFLDRRPLRGGLLLGLCFSLHPAVGVGAGFGVAAALLADRTPWRALGTAAGAALVTALPGLAATAGVRRGAGGADAWEFLVRARLPHHLDPARFAPGGYLALAVFTGLMALAFRWRPTRESRMIAAFVAGTGALFLAGLVARAAGAWPFLQLYPFRAYPLVLPMLVTPLLLAEAARRRGDPAGRGPVLAGLALALAVLLVQPARLPGLGPRRGARLVAVPLTPAERYHLARAAAWVADSAPPEAVVLVAPDSKRAFVDFRRALVVNWHAVRYDRFPEWRRRIEALAGPVPADGSVPAAAFARRFNAIPPDSMAALGVRYGATLVVTRATYPFPVRFREGAVAVYALPASAPDSLSSPRRPP